MRWLPFGPGAPPPARGGLGRVRELLSELSLLTEPQLRERAALRGADAPEAIALAAEAVRRVHGLAAYDVQLQGALALSGQSLVEMATGEGKTLVAFLAAFRYAVEGHGVHVATVNPYLAARDHEFAAPVAALLGFTAGLLPDGNATEAKRAAYAADLTYAVGSELGFDYLRDQLLLRAHGRTVPLFHEVLLGRAPGTPALTQRGHPYAIIDEADSVLIDEARSPLVIAAGARGSHPRPEVFQLAARVAAEMQAGRDFILSTEGRGIEWTEAGRDLAFARLTDGIVTGLQRVWPTYVEAALRARHHFRRDVQYVVQEGAVVIVDEFTGRLCPERTWREGLHQAVEAAAGVTITTENHTEATISRPRYFQLYRGFCGLTGTATEVARELRTVYGLAPTVLPPHRPSQRTLLPDRVFRSRAAKLAAAAAEIAQRRARGQPVLVGSRTIEGSESMLEALRAHAVPCVLLNGKQDADEARIIGEAGTPGAVTIATNMAGRGAHIPVPTESLAAGGLHVLGLERHEAGRIDRQLIGRAARQGQPGSAQFFLSLDDSLLADFAPRVAERLRTHLEDELPPATARHFLHVQRTIELRDRELRRQLARDDEQIDDLKQAL